MITVTQQRHELLSRQLSRTGIWLLIINGMIGAGIFGLPGALSRLTGDGSIWVFPLCALMIAPIMLCFAQLSSFFHSTGGPIVYASEAFGSLAGFQVGWLYYLSRVLSFAANLNLVIASIGYLVPGILSPTWRIVCIFVVCALMTLANVMGARGAMRTLGLLTVLKMLPLIGLVVIGFFRLDIGSLLPSDLDAGSIDNLGAAVFLVIYAYVGFEGGLVTAGEALRPQRDTPRALLSALVMCAIVYTLIQTVAQASLPELGLSSRPLVDVAAALIGEPGALIMLVAIIASVGGNLLSAMFSTPRMTYRMALDGNLPAILGRVHPRFETPAASILLYGAASFAFAVSGGFVWLAGLSVLARLFLYTVCVSALPRLKRRYGGHPESMHLLGGSLWVLLALFACAFLLWQVTLESILVTAGCVAVGCLLYVLARRDRRRTAATRFPS